MLNKEDKIYMNSLVSKIVDEKLQKSKPSKFVLWSRSWFNYLTPPSIVAVIWFFANYAANSKTLQFDNTNQKETIINYVSSAPNPIVLDAVKKHITHPGVHMPKNEKDSVYVTRSEYLELIKSNAIDMYNMGRTQKQTLKEVRSQGLYVNRTLEVMSYKLDQLERK
jgi:hypothetical protein